METWHKNALQRWTRTIVSRVPSTNYAEIRKMWDEWDLRNGKKDDQLEFDGFYDGFLEGLNRLKHAINKPCKETS